ncbi:MAG: SPOR domain-containing protein [Oscillatoriales cyanobacterium SM2_3_0]|nr:SPOR domain-containing protein [Oscillatoriales cyanobacterium SM2_3_0]
MSEELLPESSLPPVQTAPAQTPKPPAGAPPQPKAAQPVIAADGLYYVVASYGDAASLENARAMVPDAYIREFQTGTKVQLGALDSPVAAQQLANELNAQGLTPQFDVPAAGE